LNNIINHIKKYEEFVGFTYDDASYPPKKVEPGKSCRGTCTIGYGTTDPAKAKPGATVSESVASSWLTDFVEDECIPCIKRWQKDTKTKVTPSIFEALIDVVYNKGCSGFRKSPIATQLEKKNVVGAGDELKNWQGWGNKNRREAVYNNFFKRGIK
jgi:GH24 family phage-related lysozyme (muramidase)